MKTKFPWRLSTLLILLATGGAAFAQSWPVKPVRVIVPFGPGGSADTLGRLVSAKLGETFGQSFIVENRAGAGGMIGSDQVAKAAPDGYLLAVSGVATHAVAPALTDKPIFDPVNDFSHIALFGGPPLVFAVNLAVPARDLKSLIALAKAKPDALAFGSPGIGTHGHLFGELLKQINGIQMTHVPYKGGAAAVADVAAGHLMSISTTLATAGGQIRANKIRALAISAEARLADYKDVPTFKELGYPNLVAVTWFSLSGPAGMQTDVVNRINTEVRRALQLPDVRERLRPEGIEPGNLSAREFTEFVAAEYKRWAPVAKASGAKVD
ncbi:MAG: Bug family tripartite tricarboxylate transporter substrate binding protein [Burkholderiales bacterium]